MIRWLNRAPVIPPFSKANPGDGTSVRVGFSRANRTWEEEANVLTALISLLKSRGMRPRHAQEWLALSNGLILRPQFVSLQPRDDEAVATTTTIEVNHPVLCPEGTFEYQHSIGNTLGDSVGKGIASWADVDLPVFMDALRDTPQECTAVVKEVVADTRPKRKRQILFGPPVHAVTREVRESGQAHDFCPCCMLTGCFDAFQEVVESDGFCGVRLFASRDQDGVPQADCRINGVDWAPGTAALLKYIATWPDRGFEYRKQFVAIRTLAG
jgi:hypothetical protein